MTVWRRPRRGRRHHRCRLGRGGRDPPDRRWRPTAARRTHPTPSGDARRAMPPCSRPAGASTFTSPRHAPLPQHRHRPAELHAVLLRGERSSKGLEQARDAARTDQVTWPVAWPGLRRTGTGPPGRPGALLRLDHASSPDATQQAPDVPDASAVGHAPRPAPGETEKPSCGASGWTEPTVSPYRAGRHQATLTGLNLAAEPD